MSGLSPDKAQQYDLIEKWFLTSALMGINTQELWDSNQNEVAEVIEYIEQLSEQRLQEAKRYPPFVVATNALNMGIDYNVLSEFYEHREELRNKQEAERLLQEELENPNLVELRETYEFQKVLGKNKNQSYWKFKGDIGTGCKDYDCRIVQLTYSKFRLWFESGKERIKVELSKYDIPALDATWPSAWRTRGTVVPAYIPYLITHAKLKKQAKILLSKQKAKETRDAKRNSRITAV